MLQKGNVLRNFSRSFSIKLVVVIDDIFEKVKCYFLIQNFKDAIILYILKFSSFT